MSLLSRLCVGLRLPSSAFCFNAPLFALCAASQPAVQQADSSIRRSQRIPETSASSQRGRAQWPHSKNAVLPAATVEVQSGRQKAIHVPAFGTIPTLTRRNPRIASQQFLIRLPIRCSMLPHASGDSAKHAARRGAIGREGETAHESVPGIAPVKVHGGSAYQPLTSASFVTDRDRGGGGLQHLLGLVRVALRPSQENLVRRCEVGDEAHGAHSLIIFKKSRNRSDR